MDHNNFRVKNAMQSVDLIIRLKVLSAVKRSHHAKPKKVDASRVAVGGSRLCLQTTSFSHR